MKIFAIRDDDTSIYTSVEDIQYAYSEFFGRVPVSLAVIPFCAENNARGGRKFSYPEGVLGGCDISLNFPLVSFIREKIKLGHVEVMLHGFDHEFEFRNGEWVSECIRKNKDRLLEDLKRGKEHLEDIFGCEVNVFVPPANDIDSKGILALRQLGMNLSGMMGFYDRPFSLGYLRAWLFRWSWRVAKRRPYPRVLSYDGHSELYANALNPFVSEASLMDDLRAAAKLNAPFVVSTHYWAFKESSHTGCLLLSAVQEAERLGYVFGTVKQAIENRLD